MKLSVLLKSLGKYKIHGSEDLEISSIVDDSRKIKKGSLFVAIKGLTVDAHDFIDDAMSAGVTCVVGERVPKKSWLKKISYIEVENSRKALSLLAAAWYGNPSKKLKVIGVTGTDGKTTTANLIYWILKQAGKKVGLISTIKVKIGGKEYDTGFHVTNPEPIPLQKFLKKMVDEGCEYAVLEVTSHGLQQDRVAGVDFEIGVFTNIAHEHIDYHGSFLEYLRAKTKLFENVNVAVLNADDTNYLEFECAAPSQASVVLYALEKRDLDQGLNVIAKNVEFLKTGMEFDVCRREGSFHIKTKLQGDYNVSNILSAIGVAISCRVSVAIIKKAIANFKLLKGRLEEIKNDKGFRIFIDFAHTPNALKQVLGLLSKQTKGRLIVVFGCAGERDIAKRAMMGEISGKLADISIFTAEDPRSEDVNEIIDQMIKGAKKSGAERLDTKRSTDLDQWIGNHCYVRIPERGEAIAFALQEIAKKGDTIVICGKGHEKSMAYKGVEYPWSDHEAVKSALEGKIKIIKRK